jgi:hypothetical protein
MKKRWYINLNRTGLLSHCPVPSRRRGLGGLGAIHSCLLTMDSSSYPLTIHKPPAIVPVERILVFITIAGNSRVVLDFKPC